MVGVLVLPGVDELMPDHILGGVEPCVTDDVFAHADHDMFAFSCAYAVAAFCACSGFEDDP